MTWWNRLKHRLFRQGIDSSLYTWEIAAVHALLCELSGCERALLIKQFSTFHGVARIDPYRQSLFSDLNDPLNGCGWTREMLFPHADYRELVARVKIRLSPGKKSAKAEMHFHRGRLSLLIFNGPLESSDQTKIPMRGLDIEDRRWGDLVLGFHGLGMEKLRLEGSVMNAPHRSREMEKPKRLLE